MVDALAALMVAKSVGSLVIGRAEKMVHETAAL